MFALIASHTAFALSPKTSLTQYAHNAWRTLDGVFDGIPTAIAQTSDGYLWIGTNSALYRFDGVSFLPFGQLTRQPAAETAVYALFGASEGSLWIGGDRQLLRYRGDTLQVIPLTGRVNAIAESSDGTIWIARSRVKKGFFCKVTGAQIDCSPSDQHTELLGGLSLTIGTDKTIWTGTTGGLLSFRDGNVRSYVLPSLQATPGLGGITGIAPNPDGSIELGTVQPGVGLGLQRFTNGRLSKPQVAGFDPERFRIVSLIRDHHGVLWLGTDGQGIFRILPDGTLSHFGALEGLSSDTVNAIFEDREGGLWMATGRGLDHLRDLPVLSYSSREGLRSDYIGAILPRRDGSLSVAVGQGIDRLSGGIVTHVTIPFPEHEIEMRAAFADSHDDLWFGSNADLWLYRKGALTRILQPDGKPAGPVRHIVGSVEGEIWVVGVAGTLFVVRPDTTIAQPIASPFPVLQVASSLGGGVWLSSRTSAALYRNGRFFQEGNPVTHMGFRDLVETKEGFLFATGPDSLLLSDGRRTKLLRAGQALPCPLFGPLALDAQQNLWVAAACGYLRFSLTSLRQLKDDTKPDIILDGIDGAVPTYLDFGPAHALTSDGRLFFATEFGVQAFDPGRLWVDNAAPTTFITRVLVDNRTFDLATKGNLSIPSRSGSLEFDYTSPALSSPQKINFRYRLIGYEQGWEFAGRRRQAFYTNLAPRDYRFEVEASDPLGNWIGSSTSIGFTVEPVWYQRPFLQALGIVMLVLCIWLAYRSRLRILAQALSMRFEERMQERTRVARDLHDTMLQTVEGSRLIAETAAGRFQQSSEMAEIIAVLSERLQQAAREGRSTLESLREEEIGFADLDAALRSAIEKISIPASTRFDYQMIGDCRPTNRLVSRELALIVLEALRNAVLHARAGHISVQIQCGRNVMLVVKDDGVGISALIQEDGAPMHYGLRGMRERAQRIGANLRIANSNPSGTTISISIPGGLIFKTRRPVTWGLRALPSKLSGWFPWSRKRI